MRDTLSMTFGERRNINILVNSIDKHEFDVSNATYILKLGDVIEDSGKCTLITHSPCSTEIVALIEPRAKRARYTLEIWYTINPEKFVYYLDIRSV